jgi:phage tail tape-measure protein
MVTMSDNEGRRIGPALTRTVVALDPPESDAALVCLGEVIAETIDGMAIGQRGMMLGQTAPLLLKVLQELEERSRKRRAPEKPVQRPNKVRDIRSAAAQAQAARRKRAG